MSYYTEPRWEEAPEGTTGFLPETDRFWASWVKKIGDIIYTANTDSGEFEYDNKLCHPGWTTRRDMYIPRPEQERPKPNWDEAPEDATGYIPGTNKIKACWVKLDVENRFVYLRLVNSQYSPQRWNNRNYFDTGTWLENKNMYIPRPSALTVEPLAPVTEDNYFDHNWLEL